MEEQIYIWPVVMSVSPSCQYIDVKMYSPTKH